MYGHTRFHQILRSLVSTLLVWPFLGSVHASGEERIIREVKIYGDMPTGDADTRSETELYYEPYYYSPAVKAQDISLNVFHNAAELGGQGTCIEIMAKFTGPNEFVQIGFVPTNAKRLGERPGLDIAELLGVGPSQKIYLELKARRRANDHCLVSFRVGGQTGFPHKDSLRFPVTRTPDLDELTADWTTYRIDLSKHVHKLNAVLCPLIITMEINKNPRAKRERDPITREEEPHVSLVLYVDDVRFICVSDN